MAAKLSDLFQSVVDLELWPTGWSGSRVVEVHKKKGSKQDCDEYRGIHLDNHMGKGLKEVLNEEVRDLYEVGMPSCQYGAVRKRGTDFASHVVLSFLEYCKVCSLCAFVLYVDLSKAFDKAIRELVLGIQFDCTCPSAYLTGLGVAAHQIEGIVEIFTQSTGLSCSNGAFPTRSSALL